MHYAMNHFTDISNIIAFVLQSTGIDMSEAEIDKLITSLDQDGDGEIDYG